MKFSLKTKLVTALSVITIAGCSPAYAEFWTGNDLHKHLNSSSAADKLLAAGYIAGAADAGQGVSHCIPSSVQLGQVIDITKEFVQQNPTLRHGYSADQFVYAILKQVWPCEQQQQGINRNQNL